MLSAGSNVTFTATGSGVSRAIEISATGGGGGGIDVNTARDTAGALLDGLSQFGYVASTDTLTFTDGSIGSAQITDASIVSADIATGGVAGVDILNGGVQLVDLNSDATVHLLPQSGCSAGQVAYRGRWRMDIRR